MKIADIRPKKFYSTIKKCYLWKQDEPQPKNAIRLFCYVGGNSGVEGNLLLYPGMTAIALAQLLTALGYAVNIICVTGARYQGVTHYQSFPIKSFGEPIETETLLYVLADPTFFRVKIFDYFCSVWIKYKQDCPESLGQSVDIGSVERAVFKSYIRRDKHKNILYYFIGATYSEEECMQQLRQIALDVINANKQARADMGMTSMPEQQEQST